MKDMENAYKLAIKKFMEKQNVPPALFVVKNDYQKKRLQTLVASSVGARNFSTDDFLRGRASNKKVYAIVEKSEQETFVRMNPIIGANTLVMDFTNEAEVKELMLLDTPR